MFLHPQQTISDGNNTITYSEMVNRVEKNSDEIKGFKCCGIMCESELNCAITVLSCLVAGVTALPLSFRYGINHCDRIIKKISPDAIVTDEEGTLSVKKVFNSKYNEPSKHPFLIMCTSGTTGDPKGVMLSEKNIKTNYHDIIRYFKISDKDSILISRPLYHCAVLTGEFLVALYCGAKIVFCSKSFNPLLLYSTINKKKITVFCGTPTLMQILARIIGTKETSLRTIGISGESMSEREANLIFETFTNAKIYYFYGLTEASPRISYLPPYLFHIYPECVGKPLKSVKIKIVNKNNKKVQKGEQGLLYVKGGNVMIGYYNDPNLTKKTLNIGWLCTGDIAVREDNNLLKIIGRRDDMIIKAGMNIYPTEIEKSLKADKRVREIVAYGYKDENGTVKIGIRLSGDFACENEVMSLCEELLPHYELPSEIIIQAELPRNGSGKVIRGRMD